MNPNDSCFNTPCFEMDWSDHADLLLEAYQRYFCTWAESMQVQELANYCSWNSSFEHFCPSPQTEKDGSGALSPPPNTLPSVNSNTEGGRILPRKPQDGSQSTESASTALSKVQMIPQQQNNEEIKRSKHANYRDMINYEALEVWTTAYKFE